MQQVMRRIHTHPPTPPPHTHTGDGFSKNESGFDQVFAAMVAGSVGSDKAGSSNHMGHEKNIAGTFRHMNGSDSTSSMYLCMQVCMFVCLHVCMNIHMYEGLHMCMYGCMHV